MLLILIPEQITIMSSTGGGGGNRGEGGGERKKKESILDLSKFLEKPVRIKFAGGRECSGKAKKRGPSRASEIIWK